MDKAVAFDTRIELHSQESLLNKLIRFECQDVNIQKQVVYYSKISELGCSWPCVIERVDHQVAKRMTPLP